MSVSPDSTLTPANLPPTSGPAPTVTILNPLTESRWDQRVAQLPAATIFHSAGWARVLHLTYGFQPYYLVEQQGDAFTGVLPLMEIRSLWGHRRAVSLPFSDTCSPLLAPLGALESLGAPASPPAFPEALTSLEAPASSPACLGTPASPPASPPPPQTQKRRLEASAPRSDLSALSDSPLLPTHPTWTRLLHQAGQLAEDRGWTHLELRPGYPIEGSPAASTRYYGHEVTLESTEAAQLSACEPSVRRSLRQAQTSGLKVTHGSDWPMVQTYFRLHCLTRRRQGAPPQPMTFFAHLHQELLVRGLGFVVLVWHESLAIAGAVFLHSGAKAVYKFGASDLKFQHVRPNQLLMWTGLRQASKLGCTSMDLGRTSLTNEGLRRFKRSWGARETIHAYHRWETRTGRTVPLPDRSSGWQTILFRRLPSWASQIIGRLAYRFAA